MQDIVVDSRVLMPTSAQAMPSVGAQVCGDIVAATPCPSAVTEATLLAGAGTGSFFRVGRGALAYWRSDGASGSATGGVTFTVPVAWPEGRYEVSFSYESLGAAVSASNALLRILPPAQAVAQPETFYVNQRSDPVGGAMDDAGRVFTAPFLVTLGGGTRFVVSANDGGADGIVTARAVRLQRVGTDGCLV